MEILRLATRRPVVIVAEDFENDVLDTLITNKLTIGAKFEPSKLLDMEKLGILLWRNYLI